MKKAADPTSIGDPSQPAFQPRKLWRRKLGQHPKSLFNTVFKGAGTTFTIKVLGLTLGYLSQVVLARLLGQTQFGIYAYAWTVTRVLGVFGAIGFDSATLRFLPQYVAGKEWPRAAALLRHGPVIVALAASILALGAGLVITLAGSRFPAPYHLSLWFALGAIPFLALINLRRATARCLDRIALAYIPRSIAFPLLVPAVALVLSGWGVAPTADMVMGVVAGVLLAIMLGQAGLLRAGLPPHIRDARPNPERRHWLRVSLPLLLMVGCRVLLGQAGILILGVFNNPEDVAIFFAASKIADAMGIFLVAANSLGAPKIASLNAHHEHAQLQKLTVHIARMAFWPSFVAVAGLLCFGNILLGLFGPAFGQGALIVNILMIGVLISASVGPVGYLLALTGHHDLAAWIFGASVLVNIGLNLVLIPPFGISGAAVATTAGVAFKNIVTFFFVRHRLKIHACVFLAPRTGGNK